MHTALAIVRIGRIRGKAGTRLALIGYHEGKVHNPRVTQGLERFPVEWSLSMSAVVCSDRLSSLGTDLESVRGHQPQQPARWHRFRDKERLRTSLDSVCCISLPQMKKLAVSNQVIPASFVPCSGDVRTNIVQANQCG